MRDIDPNVFSEKLQTLYAKDILTSEDLVECKNPSAEI